MYMFKQHVYDWVIRDRMPLFLLYKSIKKLVSYIPDGKLHNFGKILADKFQCFICSYDLQVTKNFGHCKNYEICEIADFLTSDECDIIRKIAEQRELEQSTVVNDDGISVIDLYTRKSFQTWLKNKECLTTQKIAKMVSDIVDVPIAHQEKLQVVAYRPGGYYRQHYDASYHPDVIANTHRGCGPRIYTILIYLNDDFEGGETFFEWANLTVKPKKGKAIIFQNLDANLDLIPESLHAGLPISNGIKWIANKWVRVWPFKLQNNYSISKKGDMWKDGIVMAKDWISMLRFNRPWIPSSILKDTHIVELPRLLPETMCNKLLYNSTGKEEVDTILTEKWISYIPIPSNNKRDFIGPLTSGLPVRGPEYGLPLCVLYIFVEDDNKSGIHFPYINKTIYAKKGHAVFVYLLDQNLARNVASNHIFIGKPAIYYKYAYTLPCKFQSMLDNRPLFERKIANITSERYFKLDNSEMNNIRPWYFSDSAIHGLGVFANKKIEADIIIDIVINCAKVVTYFGSKINHSWIPNSTLIYDSLTGNYYLYSLKVIDKNEEITCDYRYTPDFIQKPDPNWK